MAKKKKDELRTKGGRGAKRVSPVCCRSMKGNFKRRKRKSDYWFFSLLLLSPALCHTRGQLWNQKAPYNFSFSFSCSTLTPFSFPRAHCSSHIFSSFAPLSNISIPLLCQITILICLHSPPLESHTAPPPCIFFCLTAAPGGVGQLKGGVVAISQAPLVCYRVREWRRKRGRGGGCSVADPRWSQLHVSSSVLFRFVLSSPCMLLMAS